MYVLPERKKFTIFIKLTTRRKGGNGMICEMSVLIKICFHKGLRNKVRSRKIIFNPSKHNCSADLLSQQRIQAGKDFQMIVCPQSEGLHFAPSH